MGAGQRAAANFAKTLFKAPIRLFAQITDYNIKTKLRLIAHWYKNNLNKKIIKNRR